jgi:hypothetical protein
LHLNDQAALVGGVNGCESGEAMTKYWCYALNNEGRVNARETLEASNDNEAFGTAQRYLAGNLAIRSVEVWLEDRYVGKIHRN